MKAIKHISHDILRNVIPAYIRHRLHAKLLPRTHPALLHALQNLPLVQSGTVPLDQLPTPFVKLEGGILLFGRWPNEYERAIYRVWRSQLPVALEEAAIRVAIDVIERYLYPHAMPHITMPYPREERRRFHRQHAETIADLPHLSAQDIAHLQEHFRPKLGERLLDVGAYIGFGTVRIAQTVGQWGKVIAIEADPDANRLLEHNVNINSLDNVRILHRAIWRTTGERLTFYRSARQANALHSDMISATNAINVESITIDDILAGMETPCVDYISITVNGAELEAVEGMSQTLERCPSLRLSIAGWYRREGERICDRITPILRKAGFQVAVGRMGAILAWKENILSSDLLARLNC